jgi:hypothetical protein
VDDLMFAFGSRGLSAPLTTPLSVPQGCLVIADDNRMLAIRAGQGLPGAECASAGSSASLPAARSLAIGNPADGDLAVATARDSAGAIYAVPEEEIGEEMGRLAESAGVSARRRPA